MIFKKGHIVPRWCHAVAGDRKAQHNIKFHCDVDVTHIDGVIHCKMLSEGALFYIPIKITRKMRNGTLKPVKIKVKDVCCDSSLVRESNPKFAILE